jgi:hypothetical protein
MHNVAPRGSLGSPRLHRAVGWATAVVGLRSLLESQNPHEQLSNRVFPQQSIGAPPRTESRQVRYAELVRGRSMGSDMPPLAKKALFLNGLARLVLVGQAALCQPAI